MKFREFMLEEGDLLDALCHGIKTGYKAFVKKREQQAKKTESKVTQQKLLNATGKDLHDLVKLAVNDKMSIDKQCGKQILATDWLKECTNTRTGSGLGKLNGLTWELYKNSRERVGGEPIKPSS